MAEVLYRKYRPQQFSKVTGQNHIRITLEHQIESGKIAHAYLFCGPRGVSKTTIARIVSKSLNCEQRHAASAEPCDACASCRDIVEARSLDVIEIDAASHTGVDHVRENIIENARFHPTRSKYKIYIIDEVHMLSTSAFNALLKTLEEPPPYVVFILVTTESHKIPATIISRCQRFDFHKIPINEMIQTMHEIVLQEGRDVERGVLEDIARHADGCLRDALSLLDQVLSLGESRITKDQVALILPPSSWQGVLEMSEHLVHKDIKRAWSVLNQLLESGVDMSFFSDELMDFFRKLLVVKMTETFDTFSFEVSSEDIKRIEAILGKLDRAQIVAILTILLERSSQIKHYRVPQLPLEIAMVEMVEKLSSSSSPWTMSPSKDHQTPDPATETPKSAEGANAEVLQTQESRPVSLEISTFSIEQIRKQWYALISALQEEHHSLALLLKVACPLEVRGRTLVIGFPFRLHRERVNELKHRAVISDVLSKLVGSIVQIECEVSDAAKIDMVPLDELVSAEIGASDQEDPGMSSILEQFGGRVVG